MPRLSINYSKTIIYKICCNDLNISDIYVGHTTDLIRRRQHHKTSCNNEKNKEYNQYKYQFIRDNGGWDNFNIVPIEEFPCENVNQATIRERYWIEELKSTLNKQIPSRSKKEYCEINKEIICDRSKKYYENNKDKITEYKKKWCENNKEKISEKAKEYRQENKDKIKEKDKQKYERNKDKLLEKITCECGGHYIFMSKARHLKTKKHNDYLSRVYKNT